MQLAKLVRLALEETRMLALGAQILLGFELSGVFQEGFASLPSHARYLDGTALLLMIVTIALLITPETFHQIIDVGVNTGRFHQLISRMADSALLPFAISLGIALFIAGESIFGLSAGLAIGCLFTLCALGCWYAIQHLRRLQTGQKERATSAHQQASTETTPLNDRISEMLTEARVVLPGVQAVLGFQLISVLSESFAKLPASSKVVHAISLGCIAFSVILLIAPAAYHRIVFSGQNTEEVHRIGSWFIISATVPLALGLTGDIYVVLAVITASVTLGAFFASLTLILLLGLWHVFPLVSRWRGVRGSG